jgi:flagellar protein FlaI
MQELISRYRTGTESDISELGRKKSFFELVDSQMLEVKRQYFDVLEHMEKDLEGAIVADVQKERLKRIKSFTKEARDSIAEIVLWNSLGYGPFFMTQDPLIEEITVNGPETPMEVYLRRQKVKIGGKSGYIEGWISTNFMFTANTKDFQTKFINKLTFWEKIPKKLVAKRKLVDFALPDGSRLNATIPPLSPNGYTTTIRVFRKRPISPLELIEYNTISSQGLSLLSLLLWYGYPTRNIIVIGPTSSGKTSTVNALCSFIPSNSRIIIPEETMELNLPHPPKKIVRHIATEDTPLSNIIINTLRERPDRIVIGEVRKPDEIKALFECFSTSPGMQTISTSHGKNPRAVFKKFMQVGGVAPINFPKRSYEIETSR